MFDTIGTFGRVYKYVTAYNYDWGKSRYDTLIAKRNSGYEFTMRDHLESLILSLLSANRPWYQIEQNLDNMKSVFHNYDPEYLYNADPRSLAGSVTFYSCGNRRIYTQMEELKYNIDILRQIEKDWGSVDYFANKAANGDVLGVVYTLSNNKSCYKLKGVAEALAFNYLKSIGVDCVKPDVHLVRILQRLGYFKHTPNPTEVFDMCKKLSSDYNINMCDVGAILWCFCATGYIEICTAEPRCYDCPIQCPYSTGAGSKVKEKQDIILWLNWSKDKSEEEKNKIFEIVGSSDSEKVASYLRNTVYGTKDENWY